MLITIPKNVTRTEIIKTLREQLGETSEQTEHLLDYILDAWETRDLLAERFGSTIARKIINTPPYKARKDGVYGP